MLFIALIVAACLYVGLYLLWQASQSHLSGPTNMLRLLNDMLITPRADIFFLLRSLILIVFLYLVADFIYTSIRGTRKKRSKDAEAKISVAKPKPVDKPGKTSRH